MACRSCILKKRGSYPKHSFLFLRFFWSIYIDHHWLMNGSMPFELSPLQTDRQTDWLRENWQTTMIIGWSKSFLTCFDVLSLSLSLIQKNVLKNPVNPTMYTSHTMDIRVITVILILNLVPGVNKKEKEKTVLQNENVQEIHL